MANPTITLRLHDDFDITSDIDPSRLTSRARALAEALTPGAGNPGGTRGPVRLQSDRTMADLGLDPLWHGPDLDRPHTTVWASWERYPADSPVDPYRYLEMQAAKLPVGYYPCGVESSPAAHDSADLITRAQVIEVMRAAGRPITVGTLDNYRSRPPAGWPGPAEYIGRTPMWSRTAIVEYARSVG